MSPSDVFRIIEEQGKEYVFLVATLMVRTESDKKEQKKMERKTK